MNQCKRCGEFYFYNQDCACREFTIVDADGDDHTIWAFEEYFAALKFAQDTNERNDYFLMNNSEEITVNGKKYRISAEPDVSYSASEVSE